MFSKTLLSSNALSDVNSKERMQEISRQWKELSESEKNIYNDKALQVKRTYVHLNFSQPIFSYSYNMNIENDSTSIWSLFLPNGDSLKASPSKEQEFLIPK